MSKELLNRRRFIMGQIVTGFRWLKLKSTGSTTVSMLNVGDNAPDIKYSLDDGTTWTQWDYSTINLSDGDELCFKGTNPYGVSKSSTIFSRFVLGGSGTIAASGDVTALINSAGGNCTLPDYAFYELFLNCSVLTSAPALPSTSLGVYCYGSMFKGCTNLQAAPDLPALTLADYCYQAMFYSCTALTDAPELCAETLVLGCYSQIFEYCSNLNYIKCLATDISASNCTVGFAYGTASTGIFVKASGITWPSGSDGIPYNWTVQDAQ